jgi:hypothetical protein
VPLKYQTGARIGEHNTWLRPGDQVAIQLVDQRQTPRGQLGQNVQNSQEPVPVYENPQGGSSEMIQRALAAELQGLGLQIVAPQQARRVIRVYLINLWIQEDNTYNGEVRARIMVLNPAGQMLSDGVFVGSSKRFGRSLSVENYQETLTSMTREIIENWLETESVQAAFKEA